MKLKMRSVISGILVLMICLLSCAYAYPVLVSNGYSQQAYTIEKLALRSGPSTSYSEVGTFKVQYQYVTVSGRCWDSSNGIWWIECSFYYNGRNIYGWTGAKRFDSNSYNLYGLPEYEDQVDYYDYDDHYYDDDDDDGGYYYGNQYAYATQTLSLRSGPSNKTTELGSYNVSGEWILLTAKSWDSTNKIYWVKCEFNYNGRKIIGWTGAKRFDSSSYSIDSLPEY